MNASKVSNLRRKQRNEIKDGWGIIQIIPLSFLTNSRRFILKIAISTDGDFVSAHFGRCPEFTVLDIKEGKIEEKERIPNPGHHPGYIPQFLHQRGVNCIISGGMGARAAGFFNELNMRTVVGVTGRVDEVVAKLLAGALEGGESLCKPGGGRGYGLDKTVCDHPEPEEKPE